MNIREIIEKYNMSLRSDGNVGMTKKPSNLEEIKKLKPQIIEELKKIEQEEKITGDPRNGKLHLSYYNGDWYRANTIFKNGENQPEWGNNENIFSDMELNKITASFWFEEKNIGYVDSEKIVKKLAELFNCNLSTKKEKLQKKFPDLTIETRTYDNMMQGKGEYIAEIIFPDFVTFEKYVKIAFAKNIEAKKQYEQKIQSIFDIAKKTGKPQLIESCAVECNNEDEDCSTDLISIYAMPDGTQKTERCHTW